MEQYITKEKIEEILRSLWKEDDGTNPEHRICYNKALQEVQVKLDSIEIKEDTPPEHGYFKTVYICGKKPRWKIGDNLACYEFYSDREGEFVFGDVVKVELNEDYDDWLYTFDDGCTECESQLLEAEAYKNGKQF